MQQKRQGITPRRKPSKQASGAVSLMGSAIQSSQSKHAQATTVLWRRLQEGGCLVLMAVSFFLLLALITHHEGDPGWSHTPSHAGITNAGGEVGAWLSDLFFYLFGTVAYFFPSILCFASVRIFQNRFENHQTPRLLWCLRIVGFLLAVIAGSGLANLHFNAWNTSPISHATTEELSMGVGGICGQMIGTELLPVLGVVGSTLLLIGIFLAGITLATGLSWFGLMDLIGKGFMAGFEQKNLGFMTFWKLLKSITQSLVHFIFGFKTWVFDFKEKQKLRRELKLARMNDIQNEKLKEDAKRKKKEKAKLKAPKDKNEDIKLLPDFSGNSDELGLSQTGGLSLSTSSKSALSSKLSSSSKSSSNFFSKLILKSNQQTLPSLTLLEENDTSKTAQFGFSEAKLASLSKEVEARLLEFGVSATVVGVFPGPVITQFELELAAGIKVSKITGLSKDLARALSVSRVRVVEVIPGKSVIGLEIPNEHRELVRLREILESNQYQESTSPLTLALGKDISGNPAVVNLAKMPHLLVAGTTGSGKSVGVNAMLLSLLYKSTPEEIRLILIDPKMLELSIYDGIPHLLTPVVTDMKDAANALRWCVNEMERRYQLMAAVGVRNLAGFNRKVTDAEESGKPLRDPFYRPDASSQRSTNPFSDLEDMDDAQGSAFGNSKAQDFESELPPTLTRLPYIVVIIDEFADMIMVVGKKVEELIARIAQKARAAGIHLLLATQRPSVDVITGLIKANIPTRIAFQVSSRIDSRTILDQQGAEQLLGHGDMLYLPPGSGIPVRIHGAFVSDEEVHAVVKALKQSGSVDYAIDILGGLGGLGSAMGAGFNGFGNTSSGQGGYNFGSSFESDGEQDELYDQAVQIVMESRRASISNLQRRLKIGYNRAARLIETMETAGVVSPMQANGGREVLVKEVND